MEFTYKNEDGPSGQRRVLYPNKTNTPGIPDGEFQFPTDKPGIMSALQELFDMIEWEPKKEDTSPLVPKNEIILPEDGPLSGSQELHLRLLISKYWNSFPTTFKIDIILMALEELRIPLGKLKLGED